MRYAVEGLRLEAKELKVEDPPFLEGSNKRWSVAPLKFATLHFSEIYSGQARRSAKGSWRKI